MKEKWLTYLLIPIVAIIWGFAIYRYFFESTDEALPLPTTPVLLANHDSTTQVLPDTFELLGDYRDPFLSRLYVNDDAREKPKTENAPAPRPIVPKKAEIQTPSIDWRAYKYNGLIQRSGTESQLGILNIKGKAHYVKQDDVLGELTIIALNADSIQVQVGKENKTIKRR